MSRATIAMYAVSLIFTAACDCGGDSTPDGDGGGVDGSIPDGAAPDGATPDAFVPDGMRPDGAPCMPVTGSCTVGADCCSDNCEGGECLPAECADQGLACTVNGDCCSSICTAGTCRAAPRCANVGAPCASADGCCSGSCAAPGGEACAGAGGCTCAPSPSCRSAGEECTGDRQCCNGLCDRPGSAMMGRCASLSACRTAGEPCGTEGLSGSCCSTVCLDTAGTGTGQCQFLGGCRVQDELCRTSAECCSGACEANGRTLDGRPIMRCANADSCLPACEVCGEGGASSNCCPNGGGDTGCEPTGTGFRRCFGGTRDCTLPGRPCMTTAECCMETFPSIMCQPGRDGTNVCCLSDGEECAFGDVCCSGICTPDPADGVLRCGAMCIPDGRPCTTAADCCGCGCVSNGSGGQVCTNDPAQCGPCTGPQLGELCDPMGVPCCNAPAVICNTSVEFSTCILAP